ncbi:MAG: LamG domain-containing protein [Planctomycetota bacterium]|jgi:hypothetical protein
MCRKFCFITSFIYILALFPTSAARAEHIGWWTFDEGSGNIAFDLSGNGNDGILQGNPQWVDGYFGGAIDLDGNDDFIAIDGIADDLTDNNFSVSAWIKTTAGEGNVIGANDNGSGHQFIFGVTNSGTLLVEAHSNINRYPPVINDGKWHFIAYVRDGTTAYAYTDGELVGTETPDGNPAGQTRWSIGMEWDDSPSDEFTGQVDDVHFFSHPLTEDEILRVMKGEGFVLSARPSPADGAADVKPSVILTWDAGAFAASHEVYFGVDANTVKNATTASPEYKGPKALGDENYDPNKLMLNSTYFWRIDEVNEADPNNPWTGELWSFTTGDFLVIDDFESYDFEDNRIWYSWHDGIGYGGFGVDPYFTGNRTGSVVGDENTVSYTEETIVHGGSQSMPYWYDNNKRDFSNYSEAELKLDYPRDWTEQGMDKLIIWYRGILNNDAEALYVAIANNTGAAAIVVHDNPAAALIGAWTEWVIPLQSFADQGIILTDVDRIAIGVGTQGNITTPGGAGKMYFDDIRLYRLIEATTE